MTPTKTPFAGYEVLAAGDPLSADGWYFTATNPRLADRLARLGARDHRHDAHLPMVDPSEAPTVAVAADGGSLPAATAIYVTYTLNDSDDGETLPVATTTVRTPAGFVTPNSAPGAVVDYAAGTLLANAVSYAVTVADGAGGETMLGPSATVIIDPGHANAETVLSGLAAILATASGGAPGATWRLWRSIAGSTWYLLGTGTADGFTDDGVAGDCSVFPPTVTTTQGTGVLKVTVPGGQPAGAVTYNIYADYTGAFLNPCRIGTYPIADAGTEHDFGALNALLGSPPVISTCYGGAQKIDPDTDILDWPWKRPVATVADLPSVGNSDGDMREALDTHILYVWDSGTDAWVPGGGAVGAPGADGAPGAPGTNTVDVTDGTTDVAAASSIHFSGAVVADGGGGVAEVTVASGTWAAPARAHLGSAQNSDVADFLVALDTVDFGAGFDLADSRYVAAASGKYLITAEVEIEAAHYLVCKLYKNGAECSVGSAGSAATGWACANVCDVVDLAAGDYVELRGTDESGAGDALHIGASSNYMSVVQVG